MFEYIEIESREGRMRIAQERFDRDRELAQVDPNEARC